jgi:hypothetical protein
LTTENYEIKFDGKNEKFPWDFGIIGILNHMRPRRRQEHISTTR